MILRCLLFTLSSILMVMIVGVRAVTTDRIRIEPVSGLVTLNGFAETMPFRNFNRRDHHITTFPRSGRVTMQSSSNNSTGTKSNAPTDRLSLESSNQYVRARPSSPKDRTETLIKRSTSAETNFPTGSNMNSANYSTTSSVANDADGNLEDTQEQANGKQQQDIIVITEPEDIVITIRKPMGNSSSNIIPPDNAGYTPDGALQETYNIGGSNTDLSPATPLILSNFQGISGSEESESTGRGSIPSNPVLAVGRTQYVQTVSSAIRVFDKDTGDALTNVTSFDEFFLDIPNCTNNENHPSVIYDQFQDRWIISSMSSSNGGGAPFLLCVAVSQTLDATGNYFLYSMDFGETRPDSMQMGVWDDTLVLTTRNSFAGETGYFGAGVLAFDVREMYSGNAAFAFVYFLADASSTSSEKALVGDGLLPVVVDGKNKPGNKTIPLIGTQDDAMNNANGDGINIWELRLDWNDPGAASFEHVMTLEVEPVDTLFPCAGPSGRSCIPQPNTEQGLDIMSYRQRPLPRVAYRRFTDNAVLGTPTTLYESIVTTQSVEARQGMAGMRWYEIRRNGNGDYSLFQQGTYAPDDGVHRWMGSLAQDRNGNIALGYSVSSETVFPSIRFTGRLASDTLGQMTIPEESIVQGTGSQTSSLNSWGEQSTMVIDPADDCTFLYSNAYYETTSDSGWQTRIASFRLVDCTSLTNGVVVITEVAVPVVEEASQQNNSLGHDQLQGTSSGATVSSSSSSSTIVVVVMTMILVSTLCKMAS